MTEVPEAEEVSRERWLAVQTKARVYKSGSFWLYEHVCWGRGGVPVNSYPAGSQARAFEWAWGHVARCVG